MNATSLYVTTSRLVFQQNYDCTTTDSSWTDLYRLVPYLRQSLSCTVCGHMLIEPYKPIDGKCQHHICRSCIRGRKNLKPTCIWCRDNFNIERYEENTQMRLLLQCYKSLCQYIMNTPIYQLINNQQIKSDGICNNSGNNGNSNIITNGITIPNATLLEFIEEGACFQDNFKANSGLTKSAYSILPCVFNAPQQPITTSSSISITSPGQQQQNSSTYNRHQSPSLLISTPTSSPPSYVPQQQQQQQNQKQSSQQFQQVYQIHQHNSGTIISQTNKTYHQPPPPLALVNNLSCLTPVTTNLPMLGTNMITNSLQQQGRIINNNNNLSTSNQQLNQLQHQQKNNNVINESTLGATISSSVEQNINVPTIGATGTVQQISNPPPIKTVSNGSAMYSVLYTGIGNKITIKRKTDGDEDNGNKKFTNLPPPSRSIINNNKTSSSSSSKRRGCRCGNATATPGKLTCCGQRCPCYVDSKSCIDCKCRGCRNPHRPDGGKIRPMIPELACYEIQMADDSTNLTTAPIETVTGSSGIITTNTITTQSPQQFQPQNHQQLNISSTNNNYIANNKNKNNRMEISLEDFNNTNLSSLIGANGILCSSNDNDAYGTTTTVIGGTTTPTTGSTATTTTHMIPMIKKQQQTTYAFATNQTLKRLPTTQLQQQTVKLENTSRESLLIKSANGKYQVVNVYTSTPHQTNNIQRFHTIQTSMNNSSLSNNNKTINTISGLQLHQRNINLSTTQTHQIPEISTTLPQLLLQPQSHQQNNNSTTILTTSDLNTFHNNNQNHTQHQNNLNSIISSGHHSLNHQQSPTTITLSPIIVTSSSSTTNFPSELFNDVPKIENIDHLSV